MDRAGGYVRIVEETWFGDSGSRVEGMASGAIAGSHLMPGAAYVADGGSIGK